MPAAAYLALLPKSAVQWDVLVEIVIRMELRGDWTSEGSGDYSRDFSLYTHPATERLDLGLYKGLDFVYADTTALTSRASVAAVKAAAEGYFYDAAAGKLHIKITGGNSPDLTALVTAWGTIRLATSPIHFSDQPPYDAQLTGEQLPTLRQDRPDLLRGISTFPDGNLTIQNADGFWDYLAGPLFHWINNAVTFRLMGDGLLYGETETFGVMQIAKPPTPGTDTCVIQLRSRSNALARTFPQHTFADWDLAVFHDSDIGGHYMPNAWGYVYDAPLYSYIPNGGSFGFENRYLTVDPLQWSGGVGTVVVSALYAYPIGGGARQTVPTTDYLYPLANAEVWIDETNWPHASYDFTADFYTATNIADLTPIWHTCGAAAKAIISGSGAVTGAGVPAAEVDAASFAQADSDNPATIGVYAPGGPFTSVAVTAADLIDSPARPSITKSTFCQVYIGPTGLWKAQVWDPSFAAIDTLTKLTETDLFAFDPVPVVTEGLVPTVVVGYVQQQMRGTSTTTSATSTKASVALDSSEAERVETCLKDSLDAERHAARLQMVSSNPVQQYRIVTGPVLMNASVGDKVRLVRTRGPAAPTAFGEDDFDVVVEIESITKRLADMQVECIVGNMRGLGESIRRVAPDGTADWASASVTERRSYAYAHDDATERVDTADPKTYRWSLTW